MKKDLKLESLLKKLFERYPNDIIGIPTIEDLRFKQGQLDVVSYIKFLIEDGEIEEFIQS